MKHVNAASRGAVGCLILLASVDPVLACPDALWNSAQSSIGDLQQARTMPGVEFDAQRNLLKVTAQGQTMDRLLAAVSDETNISFTSYASDCGRVNIHFDFLPLETALALILKGKNYVLARQAEQGTLGVWILPAGDASALTATEIMQQEFYKEFQGYPETEQFAEELKSVEPELSRIQAVGRDVHTTEGAIPPENAHTR